MLNQAFTVRETDKVWMSGTTYIAPYESCSWPC